MHGLMALEIMEESTEKIVAKCFLNIEDISINNIMRKVDTIIKSMFADYIAQVRDPSKHGEVDISSSITERDRDVNRLVTLVFRTIKHYLENPRAKQRIDDTSMLLAQWDTARILEKIGDELKRSSRLTKDLNPQQARELIAIVEIIDEYYRNVISSLFKRDTEALYRLDLKKRYHITLLEEHRERFETSVTVSRAIQKVISLYHRVHELIQVLG